jgi:hypothetical protein
MLTLGLLLGIPFVLVVSGMAWENLGLKRQRDRLSDTIGALREENAKMSDLILAAQNERLLLPEDIPVEHMPPEQPMPVEGHPEGIQVQGPQAVVRSDHGHQPSGVDRMLDQIEHGKLTGLTPIKWGTKKEQARFAGLNSLMLAEFGDLAVRDTVDPEIKSWTPDLMYKGAIVAGLRGEQMERARRVIAIKIAEAAGKPAKLRKRPSGRQAP